MRLPGHAPVRVHRLGDRGWRDHTYVPPPNQRRVRERAGPPPDIHAAATLTDALGTRACANSHTQHTHTRRHTRTHARTHAHTALRTHAHTRTHTQDKRQCTPMCANARTYGYCMRPMIRGAQSQGLGVGSVTTTEQRRNAAPRAALTRSTARAIHPASSAVELRRKSCAARAAPQELRRKSCAVTPCARREACVAIAHPHARLARTPPCTAPDCADPHCAVPRLRPANEPRQAASIVCASSHAP